MWDGTDRRPSRRDFWVVPVLLLLFLLYLLQASAGASPLRITPESTVGHLLFASGDTPSGGRGQPVDGMSCAPAPSRGPSGTVGVAHVALVVDGTEVALPPGIGRAERGGRSCAYPIVSLGASGLVTLPERYVTLGELFDVWGWPLSTTQLARFHGTVHAFVGSTPYAGDPRGILLLPGTQVTLEVGTPLTPPKRFLFAERLPARVAFGGGAP